MDKKVFVVVGAGRGIGNHTAEIFAKNGYQIVLVARNKEKLESYAADFFKAGIECDIVTADTSNTNSLTSAFESIIDKYGAVDALLYNAAVLTPGFPTKLDSEELKEKGIYVGTVTVMGNVAPGTHFDPAKIAEKFYDIAEERTETEYVFK